jgi:hypothetical protein
MQPPQPERTCRSDACVFAAASISPRTEPHPRRRDRQRPQGTSFVHDAPSTAHLSIVSGCLEAGTRPFHRWNVPAITRSNTILQHSQKRNMLRAMLLALIQKHEQSPAFRVMDDAASLSACLLLTVSRQLNPAATSCHHAGCCRQKRGLLYAILIRFHIFYSQLSCKQKCLGHHFRALNEEDERIGRW